MDYIVNHKEYFVIIAQLAIAPLVIGVISGYVANALSAKIDKKKWEHAENYFNKQVEILLMKTLLSLRIYSGLKLDNEFAEGKKVLDFIKINLIDNIENYKKTIMFPTAKAGQMFASNLAGLKQESESLHRQLLSFQIPNAKLLKIIEDLIQEIDLILIPFQVFPEIIDPQYASDKNLELDRSSLFVNYKNLAIISYKFINDIT